ncbi:hypothetical protein G9A89_013608 [Geosiphon pyriformis]|nr:hypothetical protein G9A89_013608 [Geosiphon pyriformis]
MKQSVRFTTPYDCDEEDALDGHSKASSYKTSLHTIGNRHDLGKPHFPHKTFTLHGFGDVQKQELISIINQNGDLITENVTENTDYFVTNQSQLESNSQEYQDLVGYDNKNDVKIVSADFVYNYKAHEDYRSNVSRNSRSYDVNRIPWSHEGKRLINSSGRHLSKSWSSSTKTHNSYLLRTGARNYDDVEYFGRRIESLFSNSDDVSVSGSDDSEDRIVPTFTEGDFNQYAEVENNEDGELFDTILYGVAPLTGDAQKERIEWQSMLASVLTGEVIKSEKRRLSGSNSRQHAANLSYQIWLGVRAVTRCRVPADEKFIVEEKRRQIDKVLQDVIHFVVKPGDVPALQQIEQILKLVERCESLYPSRKAMMGEKPLYKTKEFQYNLDALNSWLTITLSLQTQLKILQNWTGNMSLEITRPKNAPANAENSSFIERILKENGLKRTFEKRTLSTLNKLLAKAKRVMIENADAFSKMNLPPYDDQLRKLLNFPTKLMEECMKLLLEYPTVSEPTMLMVDQQMEDFRVSLKLACQIKHQYLVLIKPAPGWEIPPCIDENYNTVLLDILKSYFKLLQWKLKDGAKTMFFKEAEILESEWSFLSEICLNIQGGDIETAEQLCSLTKTLLQSVMKYFESQLPLQPDLDANGIMKWYNKLLETVRIRARKLLRFTKFLFGKLENSAEYIVDDGNYPAFIEALEHSNHILVYPDTFEEDGVCIIVESSLQNQPDIIRRTLQAVFPLYDTPQDNNEEELQDLKYIIILSPRVSFEWNGPYMNISMEGVGVELKGHRTRLVADAAYLRLKECKQKFRTAVEGCGIQSVSESRANVHSVNQQMQKIKKTVYHFVSSIIHSVNHIREVTQNIECQDLIENCFSFATEFGQRCLRYMHHNKARKELNLKLTRLAIDWVSFICDDCVPTDRKTFRWAVIALEFSMAINRGNNILGLTESDFAMLRSKVSVCMTLLVSHFDVLGARSSHETQERQLQEAIGKNAVLKPSLLRYENEYLKMRKGWMEKLNKLEFDLSKKEIDQGLVGKVLDNTRPENRPLVFLASSSSNISLRWQQGNFLGGGTFGSVYVATNIDSGDVMAVKEIRFQDPSSLTSLVKSVKEEMSVMEMLNHPNIVSYYGIEVHRDRVYIFMEYCKGGSLGSLLEHGRIEDENIIKYYTQQMLKGLIYLHENNIVHRDIKPDNILLDHMGKIKFVDFGAAKVLAKNQKTLGRTTLQTNTNVHSLTGTPMYMAPEIITGQEKGRKGAMDIWSLGCCVLEMATGRRPWSNLDNEWAVMYHVVTGHPPLPDPSQLSDQGMDFLKQCFTRSSEERPSAEELLTHPWLSEDYLLSVDDWSGVASDFPSSDGTGTTTTIDTSLYYSSTNTLHSNGSFLLAESFVEKGTNNDNTKNILAPRRQPSISSIISVESDSGMGIAINDFEDAAINDVEDAASNHVPEVINSCNIRSEMSGNDQWSLVDK